MADERRESGELDRLRALSSRRILANYDRTQGQTPLYVVAIGDHRFFWGASGSLPPGGSETLYLTATGKVGGESVFTTMPWVEVSRDVAATPGGLPRAASPLSPSTGLRLAPHSGYEVQWDGVNQRFAVVVTNDTASAAGFLVKARGL